MLILIYLVFVTVVPAAYVIGHIQSDVNFKTTKGTKLYAALYFSFWRLELLQLWHSRFTLIVILSMWFHFEAVPEYSEMFPKSSSSIDSTHLDSTRVSQTARFVVPDTVSKPNPTSFQSVIQKQVKSNVPENPSMSEKSDIDSASVPNRGLLTRMLSYGLSLFTE